MVATRQCGCETRLGMRLDLNETTFGAAACTVHGVHVARALDAFRLMPPQDVDVFVLFERLFEREVELVPA